MPSPLPNAALKTRLLEKAKELGFDLTGVASTGPHPEVEYFSQWLQNGFAGGMNYLGEHFAERADLERLLPKARSVIACGIFYAPKHAKKPRHSRPFIARYARGRDYHGLMQKRLRKLAKFIRDTTQGETKIFVDTAPVIDRMLARHAGLGWFGKNSCLIDRARGSYFVIGGVITDLDLSPDTPQPDHCGSCTRCLDACPTQAFTAPFVLDAKRCISYWTIEHRGPIPDAMKPKVGDFLFGCDICQEVCPWNHQGATTEASPIHPDFMQQETAGEILDLLFSSTPKHFIEHFNGRPFRRARFDGMLRNAVIAVGHRQLRHYEKKLRRLKNAVPKEYPWLAQEIRWALTRLSALS